MVKIEEKNRKALEELSRITRNIAETKKGLIDKTELLLTLQKINDLLGNVMEDMEEISEASGHQEEKINSMKETIARVEAKSDEVKENVKVSSMWVIGVASVFVSLILMASGVAIVVLSYHKP